MTFPGEKKYIDSRKDLEQKLKDNKAEAKRANELWETIKDLSYEDLCILSGLIVERTKPMMEARKKSLDSTKKSLGVRPDLQRHERPLQVRPHD